MRAVRRVATVLAVAAAGAAGTPGFAASVENKTILATPIAMDRCPEQRVDHKQKEFMAAYMGVVVVRKPFSREACLADLKALQLSLRLIPQYKACGWSSFVAQQEKINRELRKDISELKGLGVCPKL